MSAISGMIASIKMNKRTRVSTFDKIKNFKEGAAIKLHFDKKATPRHLQKIREKLQKENTKKLTTMLIVIVVFLIVLIYAIGFVKF